jgi:hypothetical protein
VNGRTPAPDGLLSADDDTITVGELVRPALILLTDMPIYGNIPISIKANCLGAST